MRRAVERMTDHHARDARAYRGPERCDVLRADMRLDMRARVGRVLRRAEARKVLHARGVAQATCERDPDRAVSEFARAERAVGRVEDRREGDVDVRPAQRDSRVTPCLPLRRRLDPIVTLLSKKTTD